MKDIVKILLLKTVEDLTNTGKNLPKLITFLGLLAPIFIMIFATKAVLSTTPLLGFFILIFSVLISIFITVFSFNTSEYLKHKEEDINV